MHSVVLLQGYFRKGNALLGLSRKQEAQDTFQAGLDIDADSSELQVALVDVATDLERENTAIAIDLTGEGVSENENEPSKQVRCVVIGIFLNV